MGLIQPTHSARHFEILGQPFINPQRQARHDRVQVTVRNFMPQVLGHAIAPMRVHGEPRVGL